MHRVVVLLCLFGCVSLGASNVHLHGAETPPMTVGSRRALLVGCTSYPACQSIRSLKGPANDLPLFKAMLKEQFGFQEDDITTLLGWESDTSTRPTRANIVRGFERLIADAKAGDQIVILISGHGTQVPVPQTGGRTTDPSEDDDLNEVYLPADVEAWDGQKLPNAIVDDEFETWLNALADKGAHVWVTFDTCHSGTMTRAIEGEAPAEVSRMVLPDELKIPAPADRRGTGPSGQDDKVSARVPAKRRESGGTLTAFFAAQSFEEAPELPRPADAARVPGNYFGLFTYSLVKAMQRPNKPNSYRDLSQSILNLYCSERGARGPTPVFEGDLGQQVVGTRKWDHEIGYGVRLRNGQYQINAGELHGFTPGSVLRVHDSGDAEPESAQGYLKVVSATASNSVGVPCAADGQSVATALQLLETSRCLMSTRNLGDTRIKLHLRIDDTVASSTAESLRGAVNRIHPASRDLFVLHPEASSADWILHLVSPTTAKEDYRLDVQEPTGILSPLSNRIPEARLKGESTAKRPSLPLSTLQPARAIRPIPPSSDARELERLTDQLTDDVRKIFIWQNVWRVAEGVNGEAPAGDLTLTVKVEREGEEILNPPQLYAGESVEVQLRNEGVRHWWVSCLFLGSDLSITQWASGSLPRGGQFRPQTATVNSDSEGVEGFVVFASPVTTEREEPKYEFLEQGGMADLERTRALKGQPTSPFGQLMETASSGKETRGLSRTSAEQPSVMLRSWVTRAPLR